METDISTAKRLTYQNVHIPKRRL